MQATSDNIISYSVLGIMSGTSMDGVDLALCAFELSNRKWNYRIVKAETIPYDASWTETLNGLHKQSAQAYVKTDQDYGHYLGKLCREFLQAHRLKADLIASHGHTIFHQPENGFTAQIGSGAAIHAETGVPVVCDFRSLDVALGGQGAPLVPVGDELLFPEYDACLNLGGIANVSFRKDGKRSAFDVVPCNMEMNRIAEAEGRSFDANGAMAASGQVIPELLHLLNGLPFYTQTGAKSLGREWVEREFRPHLDRTRFSSSDLLATHVAHTADQLARVITDNCIQSLLITGGGAFNTHLIHVLTSKTKARIQIPDPLLVQYKEALVFAFLGLLRVSKKPNVLSRVTGSSTDHSGGALWGNIEP